MDIALLCDEYVEAFYGRTLLQPVAQVAQDIIEFEDPIAFDGPIADEDMSNVD